MGTRISYPKETKLKAVEMKLQGIPTKVIMEELTIRNDTQIETWVRWYKNGEMNRFNQPVGKQYAYGKGPADLSEVELLKHENLFLKQQLEVLKKYAELERKWLNK
jgi:transposase